MRQGDSLWTSAAGCILALGASGHESSYPIIKEVVSSSRNPEILEAYEAICEVTGLEPASNRGDGQDR